MKKILITGCSGYIGTHLTNLLKDEYIVHGLDIVDPQIMPVEFFKQDINRPFTIPHEYDAVIHLAALVNVGDSELNPIQYYITNLNGTMNVINRVKTNNFIFSSTGAAQDCLSAYGISKRAAEDVVKEYCTKHRASDYTIFRFYNVIGSTVAGPTNPDGLMYNLIKAIDTGEFTINGRDYPNTSDGTCVRDYVHVLEICDALRTSIEKPANQIECLGHGVGYTVKEMVNIFEEVNDLVIDVKYGPRRKGDIEYYVLEQTSPYMKELFTIEELLKV